MAGGGPGRGRIRVLVAEEDPRLLEGLVEALERTGRAEVWGCGNCGEAQRAAGEQNPELVFLSTGLGDPGWYALAGLLRAGAPGLLLVVMQDVVHEGRGLWNENAAKARRLRCLNFFFKPVPRSQIDRALAKTEELLP